MKRQVKSGLGWHKQKHFPEKIFRFEKLQKSACLCNWNWLSEKCLVELVLWVCPAVFNDESDIGSVTMDDDKIKEFCNITGAGAQVAQQLLQVCNGNLEMAINMHMEGETAFDVLSD